MIDYEEIIKNLDPKKVKQLLYELGAENVEEKDNCLVTNTICHNIEGGSMKLYFYYDSHIFYCYSNCEAMSIFNFLKEYYITRQVDYNWYEDIYEVVINCSYLKKDNNFFGQENRKNNLREKYLKKEKPILKIYPTEVLSVFQKSYPIEWLEDGITKEAMDKYNILYSVPQNKIIIPHYNINGELVGIRGRALDQWEVENIGKYLPIKIENQWYKHPLSLNLYGLNLNKENIKENNICYIFEGEKAVLQFENFSRTNCAVAVCGSSLNKFQLDLLLKECHPKEIILCFDKEEKKYEEKYFYKLWNMCKKYNKYCDFSFIYDRENLLEMKNSPSDKGEKIFEQLLKKRVKVK